ncbi:Leukocyte immunoglobulin-like receptor subfamily A member 2 [Myotis brandtii]|nr:Leukocyte immunoglobulin-like receptor subfamily A member 2 [Myotis brandtii]
MSGTVVAPGDNVTLQCFSRIKFYAFILTKDGAPQFTHRQSYTVQDDGLLITFHMDNVTSTQAGTYRCYGGFNKNSSMWSHPSDPLQLMVRGYILPPVIRAQPGPMVLSKKPVTILCQGPSHAEAYEIYKEKEPEPRDGRKLLVAGKTDTLYIQEMKPDRTGLYRCSYQSGGHWSPLSDILRVVMTGSYDKPSLSSMSGTVVAPGDNVTLQCFSRIKFDSFILTKEDAPQFTQRQSSTAQDNGVQTTFHMDSVTSTQAGTYRCYGAFSKDPYVWSHPSDPLQLVVRGYLLPPVITARPGPMVLYNESVTILCQGPPDAEAYEIYKVEEPEPRDRRRLLVAGMTSTLYIQEIKRDQAGLYRCSYKSGGHWSLLSDILRVVVMGEWDAGSRARRDLFAEREGGSEIWSRKQQSLCL